MTKSIKYSLFSTFLLFAIVSCDSNISNSVEKNTTKANAPTILKSESNFQITMIPDEDDPGGWFDGTTEECQVNYFSVTPYEQTFTLKWYFKTDPNEGWVYYVKKFNPPSGCEEADCLAHTFYEPGEYVWAKVKAIKQSGEISTDIVSFYVGNVFGVSCAPGDQGDGGGTGGGGGGDQQF